MKLSGVWNIRCWYLIVFCKILLISTLIVVLIICIKCKCLQWCWSVPGMSDWSVVTTQWLGQVREITMYQEVLTIEQIGMLSSYRLCVYYHPLLLRDLPRFLQSVLQRWGKLQQCPGWSHPQDVWSEPLRGRDSGRRLEFSVAKATQALTDLAHFSRRQIQFHNKQNRQTSNVVVS